MIILHEMSFYPAGAARHWRQALAQRRRSRMVATSATTPAWQGRAKRGRRDYKPLAPLHCAQVGIDAGDRRVNIRLDVHARRVARQEDRADEVVREIAGARRRGGARAIRSG